MPPSLRRCSFTELFFFLSLLSGGLYVSWFPGTSSDFFEFSTFTASKWCGVGIALCVLAELSMIGKRTQKVATTESAPRRLIIFLGLLILYTVSLFFASYYLTTALFMLSGFLFLGGRQALVSGILITAGWLITVYLVFEKLFIISLPSTI